MAPAMVERLFSFTDPESGSYGSVALSGERVAAVVAREGEVVEIDDGAATRKDGSLRVDSDAGTLVLGLAAQTTPLAFEIGPGRDARAAVGRRQQLLPAPAARPGSRAPASAGR